MHFEETAIVSAHIMEQEPNEGDSPPEIKEQPDNTGAVEEQPGAGGDFQQDEPVSPLQPGAEGDEDVGGAEDVDGDMQGQEQDFDEDRGDEYEEENGPYESGEEEEDGRNYGEGMDRPDSAIDSQHSGSGMPDEEAQEAAAGHLELLTGGSMRSRSASSRHSRPASAVMDLRGSRPNSAAIAQEIEGFEDDFMERVDEEEEDDYYDEEEEEEEMDLGPTVEELIERARAEQQRLQDVNEGMQKKVRLALNFRNKGRPTVNRDMSRLDGVATRYRSSLKQWVDTLEDRDRVESHYQTTIFGMKSTLEERIKRADDIAKAYKHFRLEVAKSSEHSKTGRSISDRLLAQLEQEDQEKEEEVQRVRLKNIHLSNQLKRIEQTLRQKEELAEGLHLIDFEQLKIENQSLNEKIEERNEELLKLRKKTTTTVQILTHVREKLQFIEKENASLAAQLEELDAQLSERRDKLGKAKAARDTLRQKGRRIKETSVFITTPALLEDIEVYKEKKEALLFQTEDLKKEFATLADTIAKANARLMSMTEEMAATGGPAVINALRSMQAGRSPSMKV